ncbi:RNA polymerase sigma-70 factor [Agriterribacter sp.]|uniref:RNA polymerase sigma factor n=1 Tax=Agriterribacter sp. TaxID=2821509 RepID=UPI002BD0FEFC|nr:RNA polymerase sigma-70 factor [Agriterribacter sp.]HRO47812.1 RNA polymerase sigma-70 factor [Agriterribacter sp.]HRQ19491.1 RNA polymerase sigma-70 factor [Agriterribacter sp.]
MSGSISINETYLLHQLADGDENAFRVLYDRYRDKLFFYVLRITGSRQIAEDVLQEVFAKIWVSREEMKDVQCFSAWLFKLAKNKTINGLRRLSLETSILAEIGFTANRQVNNTSETLDFLDTRKALQEAMEQLPPRQKLVYRLRWEQGLKSREIARHLNISPLTVKKHIAEASRSIRSLLEKKTTISITVISLIFNLPQ